MTQSAAVLDLDLDFFVTPTHHWTDHPDRLSDSDYTCASPSQVEHFLEHQCGLSKARKLPGRFCVQHDEAFHTWRQWIETGVITAPFDVFHVDAHADMGLGDPSWTYLLSEVLALPVSERSSPKPGWEGLNAGSYLPFAIANRWIRTLTYVYPSDTHIHQGYPNDLHTIFFRNEDVSGPIELLHYSRAQLDRILMASVDLPEPLSREPAIPNAYKAAESFVTEGVTHVILAQSPGYTPKTADRLIPIISDYFFPA
jgi:hypothetical protein